MTRRWMRVTLAGLVVAVTVAAGLVVFSGPGQVRVTAYFTSSTGIYEGDEVRILGVPVGRIDHISAEPGRVRIDLHYTAVQKVPADAEAAIVAPSLVTSRYVQLAPRFTGGPELSDGAVIPLERTAVPVEWDEVKAQLSRVSTALGPQDGQAQGPLGEVLSTGARTLDGQGQAVNDAITQLSSAIGTLSAGREDLFGTVRNLQEFTSALATSDRQIVEFGQRLESVSGVLADNRGQLGTSLSDLRVAIGAVETFVRDNRDRLGTSVDQLADVTGIVAAQQDDLAKALHAAPIPLANFYNIYSPTSSSLLASLAVANMANPSQFVCSGIAAAGNMDPRAAAETCAQYLGPLLDLLTQNYPPVQVNPLRRDGGSAVPSSPQQIQQAPSDIAPPLTGEGGLTELLTPEGR